MLKKYNRALFNRNENTIWDFFDNRNFVVPALDELCEPIVLDSMVIDCHALCHTSAI